MLRNIFIFIFKVFCYCFFYSFRLMIIEKNIFRLKENIVIGKFKLDLKDE